MPYKSEAQRKFFHTDTAKRAGISKKTVEEFDKSSKGMHLPRKKTKAGGHILKAVAKAVNKKD